MKKSASIILIFLNLLFVNSAFAENKIPWENRHFPNVPRISAEEAKVYQRSGAKIIIIDIPFSKKEFQDSHICGAIPATTKAHHLDRIIKKLPKGCIVFSYCK